MFKQLPYFVAIFLTIFLQLHLVKISCKLIIIWVNYEKNKKGSFLSNTVYIVIKMITKNFTETVIEMILKTDTEIIGCYCLKFFQHASLIYLFTDTCGSFQPLPFFNPILASQPHGSSTAGSMLIFISCSELAANCSHSWVIFIIYATSLRCIAFTCSTVKPVQNYTAWWQRHMYVNNLPRVITW